MYVIQSITLIPDSLGYTDIRAHTGPTISVPRRSSPQYFLYIGWNADLPDFLYTGL